MYTLRSVTKDQSRKSPGAPIPKDPNLTVIRAEDVVSMPVRNANGVKMEGNWVLKAGASAAQIYVTPSKMNPTFDNEGDEDSISVSHNFEAMHPGDSLEINEFVQNNMSRNLILIYGNCQDSIKKVYGTPCAPMQLKPSFAADNDSTNHTLTFEQFQKTADLPGHFEGALPQETATAVADENLTLSEANGYVYELAQDTLNTEIIPVNTDLKTGDFVTLKGTGGSGPYQLANPATGNVVVVLKDNVSWIALDGAIIDLEVVVADTTTYLIERQRK